MALLLHAVWYAAAQDAALISKWQDSLRPLSADTGKVNALLEKGRAAARWFDDQHKENTFFQEAITLSQNLKFYRGLATAYNEIGTSKRNKSEYILAEDYHEKALKAAREAKDSHLVSYALNNIGVDCRRMDKLQKAFDSHRQALDIAEGINDRRNICVATNSIGNILLSTEKYEDAIRHFEKALALEKESNNNLGVAINLGNLGYAWQRLGQKDLAIDYFRRSLAVNERIGNTTGMTICYNALGTAYKEKKEYGTAMSYLEKALAVNDEVDDKVHIAESYLNIGRLLGSQGKHEAGREYIQKSIAVSNFWHFKLMLMEAYKALAENYKNSGDFKKSLEALDKSLAYKDSILDEKSTLALTQMQKIYEVDQKDNQIKSLEHDKLLNELSTKRNVVFTLALAGFVIMLVTGGFFYIRHRNLQANRETLQLELRSLRSQMNPHFIFNSLSSIHRYIWSNNQEEASDYLTKFSKLMRMILDNTQHTFISLNKELESLRLYLDLESLRCNGIFDYHIHVAPDIHEEDVQIPPMILQPYVENAIWHGLVHRSEKGRLDISVALRGKTLECTITDNGIGRAKAMEIKKKKGSLHNSVGMKVTEGRIELIRKINNTKDASVTITDLEDGNGQPAGTRVTIILPAEFIF